MDGFLDIWQYMPHGMCLLWQPWLVLLWAGSDALIFMAYMAIPFALFRVVRARNDMRHGWLAMLFASFILLCGLTHLLGLITLWWPIYPYVGILKFATGVVSTLTAIVLLRLVPALIAIPSQKQLEDVNRQLRREIAEHEAARAELQAIRDRLEAEVADRTEELRNANANMAVLAREAVHRGKNLLAVVASIARQGARGQDGAEAYVQALLGRIDALASATEAVIGGQASASADLRAVVEDQLRPLTMTWGERVDISGPSVGIGSEAAQQIALALHELATNMQKYGALHEETGGVSISWRLDGSGAQERLLLEWSEDLATPDIDMEDIRSGFGDKLLTRIVPTMLKGEASRRIETDRLVYTLNIPAAELVGEEAHGNAVELANRTLKADFGLA